MGRRSWVLAIGAAVASLALSGCGVHVKGINDWDLRQPDQARHGLTKVVEKTGTQVAWVGMWNKAVTARGATGRAWSFQDGRVGHATVNDTPLRDRFNGPLFDVATIDLGEWSSRCEKGKDFVVGVYPGPTPDKPYVHYTCDSQAAWFLDGVEVPARELDSADALRAAWADLQGQGEQIQSLTLRDGSLEIIWSGRCGTRFCPWSARTGERGLAFGETIGLEEERPLPKQTYDIERMIGLIEAYAAKTGARFSAVTVTANKTVDKDFRWLLGGDSLPYCSYDASGAGVGKNIDPRC